MDLHLTFAYNEICSFRQSTTSFRTNLRRTARMAPISIRSSQVPSYLRLPKHIDSMHKQIIADESLFKRAM